MSTEHTPGPWVISTRYTNGDKLIDDFRIYDEHGNYCAELDLITLDMPVAHNKMNGGHYQGILVFGENPEIAANAALIASAPTQQAIIDCQAAEIKGLEDHLSAAEDHLSAANEDRSKTIKRLATEIDRQAKQIEQLREVLKKVGLWLDQDGAPWPTAEDAEEAYRISKLVRTALAESEGSNGN